ncbi:MAG TPA: GNAT family N-acetyltransferase [Actinomycetota bacterium]|nr:GNAT family N-acetyltransferase [Actinomycetota bacterium]
MDAPTPRLSFRPARPDEAAAIADLVNSAYRGESSRSGWTTEADFLEGRRIDEGGVRALLHQSGSVFLLGVLDGEVVATVHLERREDAAYLGLLVIRPTLQGRGMGSQVLDAAEALVRETWGSSRMTMQVISLREDLIAFYERRGYRRTGQRIPFPEVTLSTPLVQGLEFEILAKDLS